MKAKIIREHDPNLPDEEHTFPGIYKSTRTGTVYLIWEPGKGITLMSSSAFIKAGDLYFGLDRHPSNWVVFNGEIELEN